MNVVRAVLGTFGSESLNGLLEAFGQGVSWKLFEPRVPAYYRKLRLAGKWELILRALRDLRAPQTAT